jgi:hypothetical protein
MDAEDEIVGKQIDSGFVEEQDDLALCVLGVLRG